MRLAFIRVVKAPLTRKLRAKKSILTHADELNFDMQYRVKRTSSEYLLHDLDVAHERMPSYIAKKKFMRNKLLITIVQLRAPEHNPPRKISVLVNLYLFD